MRASGFFASILFSSSAMTLADSCSSVLYTLGTPEGYQHNKYAPAEIERFYDGKAFVASVDGADHDGDNEARRYLVAPQWVATHIKAYEADNPRGYAPGWSRPSKWYKLALFDEERDFHDTNKRVNRSYTGVGSVWNRGHLAQRADANRLGEEYGCNTHVFANAVPQAAKFNQGIWLGLENWISGLSNQVGDVWVTSGPIYGALPKMIGDEGEVPVAIPDNLFKVVVWEDGENLQTLSFIFPNVPGGEGYKSGRCSSDKSYSYARYLTSISDVEEKTNLTFFNQLPRAMRDRLIAYVPESIPEVEEQNLVGQCQ